MKKLCKHIMIMIILQYFNIYFRIKTHFHAIPKRTSKTTLLRDLMEVH